MPQLRLPLSRLVPIAAVVVWGAASAGAQSLVTTLDNYSPDGQTVTIPIRINCSAGATAINSLTISLKADPASDSTSTIYVNPVSREVQVFDGGTWTMWPLPTL